MQDDALPRILPFTPNPSPDSNPGPILLLAAYSIQESYSEYHSPSCRTTSFLATEGGASSRDYPPASTPGPGREVTFYDSVTGLALFIAPRGRR